jgi:UDPglucose--hexose-1-phosphate uridylyltransferase
MWKDRYEAMRTDPKIRYVFVFENRGEAVGVTMPHPHGQIYGYSFLPKKIQLELAACEKHRQQTGHCLLCDMMEEEIRFSRRVIFENESFLVFLPFFSEYPYGVYILAKRHTGSLSGMTAAERHHLASAVRQVAGMFDCLFDTCFPYMMCLHQTPVNSRMGEEDFHFHIEYFPPMRAKDRQKFNASSETGAWAHCNPTCPEEKAEELKTAHAKYIHKGF